MPGKSMLVLALLLVFAAGCAPATVLPSVTPTVQPTQAPPPLPTATPTPPPTVTNTPVPTASSTPVPTPTRTATSAPNQTESAKYFRFLGLTGQDSVTPASQFKTNGIYCLRYVAIIQMTNASYEIIDAQTGLPFLEKIGIFDGQARGVVQAGDRSSCSTLRNIKQGKYLYRVYVNDILVAALPFEIIP